MKILKSKFLWFIVILAAAGGWWFFGRNTTVAPETETVQRGDVVEIVSVSGTLKPDDSVDASFETIGTLTEVGVDVGDKVEEGQPIAQLDRSVLGAQLSKAYIAQQIAEQDEKLARRTWDEMKPEQREAKKLASQAARADVATIKRNIDKTYLSAPISGRVTEVYKKAGEVVSVAVPVVQIVAEEKMYIEADVPESDVAKLKTGQNATVTFDAFTADEKLAATVGEIDPQSTVIQDVVYYRTKFYLTKWDDRLRPGMSSDVDIETGRSENVLYLPQRAVYEDDQGTYVKVLTGDTKNYTTNRQSVETGLEDEDGNVEIKSGVNEGEVVVVD